MVREVAFWMVGNQDHSETLQESRDGDAIVIDEGGPLSNIL